MTRITKSIATVAMLVGLLAANLVAVPSVSADGTGQIEGGAPVYEVKNLTTGGAYSDNAPAGNCQQLQYSIRLHNSGFTAVNNIHVKVALPTGATTTNTSTATITYTDGLTPSTSDTTTVTSNPAQSITFHAGSTQLFDGTGKLVGNKDDGLVNGAGIDLGSLNGSTTEYLNFKADTECPQPPKTPVYTCDMFDIAADKDRTIKISKFETTATNGATFKNAVVSWGDNSADFTSATLIGQTHQYAKDGTYHVVATAHFTVNGQDVSDSGVECAKDVTFKTEVPPTVTPPTTPPAITKPTTLVNTGAGSVIGMFAAATAVGAAAYRKVLSRRLSEV